MNLILLLLLLSPDFLAADAAFDQFVAQLRSDARDQGFLSAPVESALSGLEANSKVLQLYGRQPEQSQTLRAYLSRRVSPQRIERGRQLLAEHRPLLDQIAAQYGVQPRFIVALWGNESDYGGNMGNFSVVRSLATLAYGSRRKDYFRRELLVALQILDRGDIPPEQMVGSWAGAMGQCQFMPWSFNRRAVDFDADGRRDIWHSTPDALASIANYLKAAGWRDDLTWGRAIELSPALIAQYANRTQSLLEWQKVGARRLNGTDLPQRDIEAKLIRPANAQGRAFLVYGNYDVLLKWNRSHSFAIAVGTLADRLRP